MVNSSLIKTGLCIGAVLIIWHLTSDRSRSSDKDTKLSLENVKKLLQKMHSNIGHVVIKAKNLQLGKVPDNRSVQYTLNIIGSDLALVERNAMDELGLTVGIEDLMADLTDSEEFPKISAELEKFFFSLGKGVHPPQPFYELPEGLSPMILLSISESMRRDKVSNIRKVWEDLGNKDIGVVVKETYMKRPMLRISPVAARMLEGLGKETNFTHVVQFENFFENGFSSYQSAILFMSEHFEDFKPQFDAIEKMHAEVASDLFDEIIASILKEKEDDETLQKEIKDVVESQLQQKAEEMNEDKCDKNSNCSSEHLSKRSESGVENIGSNDLNDKL